MGRAVKLAPGSDIRYSLVGMRRILTPLEIGSIVPPGAFWAKTSEAGWHPLAAHLMDVAAVMRVLFAPTATLAARARYIAQDAGVAPLPVLELATYLGLIHDVGKAHHGFQERRQGTGEVVRSSHVQRLIGDLRHARALGESASSITRLRTELLKPLRPSELPANAGEEVAFGLLSLCLAHHGRPWSAPRQPTPPAWRGDWLANALRDPIEYALHLVFRAQMISRLDGLPRELLPAESQLFAGALTLADWLGSSEEIFAFAPLMESDPDAYWLTQCERAKNELIRTGTSRPLAAASAARMHWPMIFPRLASTATVLQDHIMRTPLPEPGDVVVIESDTGSGKTEAALALYARLRAAGRVDGLFFALPTRATASAMETRVRAFAEVWCPEAAHNIVLAAGGARALTSLDEELLVDDDARESRYIAQWASRSLTKAFAGELVVGTIDQALLASLPVKHAHLRLAALSRLLIVVDELHAYDAYMLALLIRVTEYMRACGGVVVAMSATLATEVTHELAGVPTSPDRDSAMARPFPCVSSGSKSRKFRDHRIESPKEREREYDVLEIRADDCTTRAIAAARMGARVLILRNTVAAALETVEALAASVPNHVWHPDSFGPAPYHGRYTRDDRRVLDAAVRRDFGFGSTVSGTILVATQVAEQSLDVDFDLLITDLCPIDVLLQRLGRVHRHSRPRISGFDRACALVIQPDREFSEILESVLPKTWARTGLGTVYGDLAVLALTQQLIRRMPQLAVPQRNRAMIESVYHRESRDALVGSDARWDRLMNRHEGLMMGQRAIANRWKLPLLTSAYSGEAMTELFRLSVDEELRHRSRLGDDKIRLEFDTPVPNHFSQEAGDCFVDVEFRRLGVNAGADRPLVTVTKRLPDFAFTAGRLDGRYSRFGWKFSTQTH